MERQDQTGDVFAIVGGQEASLVACVVGVLQAGCEHTAVAGTEAVLPEWGLWDFQ